MSFEELGQAENELANSELRLKRYKMGLPDETALQTALIDIGDLKAKLEVSLRNAKEAIEAINDKLPQIEAQYLGRVELTEASKI